jgi:hypothetical protein
VFAEVEEIAQHLALEQAKDRLSLGGLSASSSCSSMTSSSCARSDWSPSLPSKNLRIARHSESLLSGSPDPGSPYRPFSAIRFSSPCCLSWIAIWVLDAHEGKGLYFERFHRRGIFGRYSRGRARPDAAAHGRSGARRDASSGTPFSPASRAQVSNASAMSPSSSGGPSAARRQQVFALQHREGQHVGGLVLAAPFAVERLDFGVAGNSRLAERRGLASSGATCASGGGRRCAASALPVGAPARGFEIDVEFHHGQSSVCPAEPAADANERGGGRPFHHQSCVLAARSQNREEPIAQDSPPS